MESHNYNLIIIGGGAAGMMAAISAHRHHPQLSIAIIDRTFALGRKILVCGAGRCNITNINLHKSIDSHYYGAQDEFVTSVFDQFGFDDIVSFFEDLGVDLYVERKTDIGKMFPVTNQARTITELMLDEIDRAGVDVFLNTEVEQIHHKTDNAVHSAQGMSSDAIFKLECVGLDKSGAKLSDKRSQFTAETLILSAGGKTYPALGSNGSGYTLAEQLGHSLVNPVPAALPLVAKNHLSQKLQGVRMDAEVTSLIEGEKVKTRTDELMFTKYGLSGPVILNVSRELSIYFNREKGKQASVIINFLPDKTAGDAQKMLVERWSRRLDQTVEKSMFGIFPNKFPRVILEILGIDPEHIAGDLTQSQMDKLVNALTNFQIKVTGTRGWNEAEFTAGGIAHNQITPVTLQSTKTSNVYLAGEIVDVDGDVGGFNLSWSWSSGYVAGKLQ